MELLLVIIALVAFVVMSQISILPFYLVRFDLLLVLHLIIEHFLPNFELLKAF